MFSTGEVYKEPLHCARVCVCVRVCYLQTKEHVSAAGRKSKQEL